MTTTTTANNSAHTGSTIFVHEHTHMFDVMCGGVGVKHQRELFSMSLSSASSSSAPSHPTSTPCVCEIGQQQQTSSSSAPHSSAKSIHPAELTNNNYKNNNIISSDSVSTTDNNTRGVFTLAAWMPFLQSVKRFLVSLVYASSPSPAADQDINADDRTDSSDDYSFDGDKCTLIDSLIDASLLFPRPNNLQGSRITGNYASFEQPESFLQTSLLELIAMEAPQCMAAPAQLAHGIGAAVDLYLSGLADQPEQSVTSLPAHQPSGRNSSRLSPKKMHKRKHVLRQSDGSSNQPKNKQQNGSGGCHIVWPKCGGTGAATAATDERLRGSPTLSPTTTMHTLATTLNVKPVHKHANKNRREKERHVLTRYIHDDLYDADQRQHGTTGVDDVDADSTTAIDTVDFCIVSSSSSVSATPCTASTVNTCYNVLEPEPQTSAWSFTYLSHEDFPEMGRKATAVHAATATTSTTMLAVDSDAPIAAVAAITCAVSTVNIGISVPEAELQQQQSSWSFTYLSHEEGFPEMRQEAAVAHAATATTTTTALAVDSDAPIAAVVSITVTAVSPASYTPSLSWEISADELRTPSKRPSGMRSVAAAAAVCVVDSYAPMASTSAITTQYQQLLLAGLRPPRERQISECSDDFICFERDEDAGSEGSICYDIADDSSDSDETEDDDDEHDDDSSEDDDSDDDEVDNGHSKTAQVVSDDDSESDSESETNSATLQLDSGFEENKVNKVRFAAAPQVHYIHAWHYAYRQARRSKWEQIGRDRVRFADRVRRIQDTLSAVLGAEHRERVLRRRGELPSCNTEHLM